MSRHINGTQFDHHQRETVVWLQSYEYIGQNGRMASCRISNSHHHLAQYPRTLMEEWGKELNASYDIIMQTLSLTYLYATLYVTSKKGGKLALGVTMHILSFWCYLGKEWVSSKCLFQYGIDWYINAL